MKNKGLILVILLLCFVAGDCFGSHVAGAEISYKLLFGNTYQFKLKVYRDCNQCKFNNSGGGDNPSNCNEVPDLQIKGALGTSYSSNQFGTIEVVRKIITDITPSCYGSNSKCRLGSNNTYGYEEHIFEGVFNFSQLINDGYCNFDVSISLSSRSININNVYTEQNFFNYAMINLCNGLANESVEFNSKPQFIHSLNQSNYISLNGSNDDKDSLVYSLKPALVNRNASVAYALGRNNDYPFSVYCSGMQPCQANLNGALVEGFYCSRTNGDLAFTPTQLNEGGVVVIECQEWKKRPNGTYYLAGVTRRDIYGEIFYSNNNLPQIKNKILDYTLCEGENRSIDLLIEDIPNSGFLSDTVFAYINTKLNGIKLIKVPINTAPYFKYSLQIEALKGNEGNHSVSLFVQDNHCPLNGLASKTFNFKILKSRHLNIINTLKNCGNLDVVASNFDNKNIYWTITDIENNILKQQLSRKINLQLLKGGDYIVKTYVPAEYGYCEINQLDTIHVEDFDNPEIKMGADKIICKGSLVTLEPIEFKTHDGFKLYANGSLINGFPYTYIAIQNKSITFKVEQDNGCSTSDEIEINLYPDLQYKINNDTICVNGIFPKQIENIIVDKSKINFIDYTYSSKYSNIEKINELTWNMNMIGNQAHTLHLYSLMQDKNNCYYLDTSEIMVVEPKEINVSCPTQICINSEPIQLQVKPGGKWTCINYPGLINNNVLFFNNKKYDPLLLNYTEVERCINTKTFTVNQKDTNKISFGHEKEIVLCENADLFELKGLPKGGNWFGPYTESAQFDPAKGRGKTSRLRYSYTNVSNCVSSDIVSVFVESLPQLSVKANKTRVCVGDMLELQALTSSNVNGYWYTDGEGGFTQPVSVKTSYQPNQNDVNKSVLKFIYTLQTNGICGNVSSQIEVAVKKGPVGDILNTYSSDICEPASFIFNTNFNRIEKQYWYVNDSLVEEFDYNFSLKTVLNAGKYVIKTKVFDSTCEALAISNAITVLPVPNVKMASNPSAKISREYPRIYLKDQTHSKNGHSINWYFNSTLISNEREFYYRADDDNDSFIIKLVATSNKGGCKDSLSRLFVFIPINQLYIPDAFSPDYKGPDENNVFKVKGPAMQEFGIEIFNKFGEKVFVSQNMNEAWDGTYKNENCMLGVYFYKIITTDFDGISRDYSGTVTLIR